MFVLFCGVGAVTDDPSVEVDVESFSKSPAGLGEGEVIQVVKVIFDPEASLSVAGGGEGTDANIIIVDAFGPGFLGGIGGQGADGVIIPEEGLFEIAAVFRETNGVTEIINV